MGRLDNYEEVKDRLPRFWQSTKGGRIVTEIINHSENWERVVYKASLFEGDTLIATGHAMDWKDKDRNANRTNWVEVCETSAIGRAIANSRYQDPNVPRASREEMEVAYEREENLKPSESPQATSPQKPAWVVQLETRFGQGEGKVTEYCIGKGLINKGQTWRDLSSDNRNKLIKGAEAVCKAVGI